MDTLVCIRVHFSKSLPILDYKWDKIEQKNNTLWKIAHFTGFDINPIGHVNNIPTIQFFIGISRNTQSKSYMLSLTECVWDFQNDALWDTN